MRGALATLSPSRGLLLSAAVEIESIVLSARYSSAPDSWRKVQHMLTALGQMEFKPGKGTPLRKLCAAGVEYGWDELTRGAGAELLAQISAKAGASLRRDLQQNLERITRPCLELEWTSFVLATESLGLARTSDRNAGERMFLRDRPGHRLLSLFKKFPVLARLWSLAIDQWRDHIVEVLGRAAKDRRAISRFFFNENPIGQIKDVRLGLSDRHNDGRSVTLIEFESGRLIYKPRSGTSEAAWFELLGWMNRHGFRPELQAARLLERKGYYWMEHVEAGSCKNEAAIRRFYERLGGMIAAAYLLKAVDCHRENVIAAGEYPVLVDVDALWHVSPATKTQSPADVLYRTGFFPNSKRLSLQSRSSVLGRTTTGSHLPRIAGKPLEAARYKREIVTGFTRAWHCILGKSSRRAAFLRQLRRIRSQERRWIYWATAKYAAIRQASIQPAVLRSVIERELLIDRLCSRSIVSSTVVEAEINALQRLDIPYFIRSTKESMPRHKVTLPSALPEAIRQALES